MHQNPFYDVGKADLHTPKEIAKFFVRDASPIWEDLQFPVNHLVVGARGTGKTMALRQLDFRTLASSGQIGDFVGAYVHVSRVSAIFHALFTDRNEGDDQPLIRQFQQVFADYLVLEVVRVLCDLSELGNHLVRPDFSTAFRLPSGFDTGNIAADCVRLQVQLESSIQSWQISRRCAWKPLGDLPAIVGRLAEALRQANPWLAREKPCLYLLLDESSPVPHACQTVLNSLLVRGQSYCTKLGVRPFEWHTLDTLSGWPKEWNTDVIVLYFERSNELGEAYVSQMEQIVGKVLADRQPANLDIRKVLPASADFPYSGFEAVCAASSGNPQDLLMICSAILAARCNPDYSAHSPFDPVPPSIQHEVIRTWSGDFGHQNAYDSSRQLCRSMARQVAQEQEPLRSIGFEYRSDEPDLFSEGALPDDLASHLRPAFAGGFVLPSEGTHPSLFAVPGKFRLSRGVLPDLEIALDTPTTPPVTLNRKFIETKTRTGPQSPPVKATTEPPLVYISSSFIGPTDPNWGALRQALADAGFSFPNVRKALEPPAHLRAAQQRIAKAHVAILGNRETLSRVMFEIGLCAGASRPVGVIHGRIENDEAPLGDSVGLPRLPTVSLQPDDNNYSRFATEVRMTTDRLLDHTSDFSSVALTGASLRPKRKRERTVYVSVPDHVALDAIRKGLASCGWFLITETDMKSYTASVLQVPILCAYTARVGIIDTSAADGMDAIQSYKLGLFASRRGWRVLHTSSTDYPASTLTDHVAGAEYCRWEKESELVKRILRFVQT